MEVLVSSIQKGYYSTWLIKQTNPKKQAYINKVSFSQQPPEINTCVVGGEGGGAAPGRCMHGIMQYCTVINNGGMSVNQENPEIPLLPLVASYQRRVKIKKGGEQEGGKRGYNGRNLIKKLVQLGVRVVSDT